MKIECVKEKFQFAVSRAEKIAAKNVSMPVLSCILLETKGNNLVVRATNLDLGLEISVPVKKSEDGAVCVPAHILGSFLNNLSNDKNIVLETKDGVLKIKAEKSEADIKTVPTDDFPTIPKINDGKTSAISSKDFQTGVRSVIYAASTSAVKPELGSVYIASGEEGLTFVATDSFRLAEKVVKTKKKAALPSVLIPFKNAGDILKIIEGSDGDLEITAAKNQISFVENGVYLVSRVIDGAFPDYRQIIPKSEKTKITLLKQDLADSLKLSNLFSDSFNQINITASPDSKSVETRTKNGAVGENRSEISASVEGEAVAANFNCRYIAECLPAVPEESVTLLFNGPGKPLVIRAASDASFTYLVMPMNR